MIISLLLLIIGMLFGGPMVGFCFASVYLAAKLINHIIRKDTKTENV